MSVLSDLAHVVDLALSVEDRTPDEQKALEYWADRLDRERNKHTSTNRRHDPDLPLIACTFPGHTGGDRCPICTGPPGVDYQLNVPQFSAAAKAEPLVDEDGWSIAARFVHPDA